MRWGIENTCFNFLMRIWCLWKVGVLSRPQDSAHAYHMIRPLGDAWQDMRKLLERVLSCESVDKSMKQTAP